MADVRVGATFLCVAASVLSHVVCVEHALGKGAQVMGTVLEHAPPPLRKWTVEWTVADNVKIRSNVSAKLLRAGVGQGAGPVAPAAGGDDGSSSGSEGPDEDASLGGDEDDDADSKNGVDLPEEDGGNVEDRPNVVHGVEWTLRNEVVADPRPLAHHRPGPTLRWNHIGLDGLHCFYRNEDAVRLQDRTPLMYFFLAYPLASLAQMVEFSNKELDGSHKFNVQQYFKWFGLIIAMSLNMRPTRREYWSKVSSLLVPALDFGRFMTERKWETIAAHLAFGPEKNNDKWWKARYLVYAFNLRRQQTVSPGDKLVVDESGSQWTGLGDFHPNGMPHLTKMPRKPKTQLGEVRDICDVASGIMLGLEIQDTKEIMRGARFIQECGGLAGAAAALRLAFPYRDPNQWRIVVADSAFASVTAAVSFYKHSFWFMGLVKTATRLFPKAYLNQQPCERGEHVTATARVGGEVNVMGVKWQDKTTKFFVGTCSSNAPGHPHRRKRYDIVDGEVQGIIVKEVPRPMIAEEYFDGAQMIDVHNHLRQSSINLEDTWRTKKWYHRMFATVFGMIITDAYLMYKYEKGGPEAGELSLREFTSKLAEELVMNKWNEKRARHPQDDSTDEDDDAEPVVVEFGSPKPNGKRRLQYRCRVCEAKTTLTCNNCSGGGKKVAICNPTTGRNCLSQHIANTHQ